MTFEKPDYEVFPCLKMAFEALKVGGTMPTVMNAANEKVVSLFLNEKIRFVDIPDIIEKVMAKHTLKYTPSISDILEADFWARECVDAIFGG